MDNEIDILAMLCNGDEDLLGYKVNEATAALLEESKIENAKKERKINKIKNKISTLNEQLAEWEAKVYKPNSLLIECRYEERPPISIGTVNEIKKSRRIDNIKSDIERLKGKLYSEFAVVF